MAAALSSKVAVQPAFKAAARPVARRAPVVAVRAAAVAGEVPDMNKRNIMVRSQRAREVAAWHQPPAPVKPSPAPLGSLRPHVWCQSASLHCRTCCCWALSVPRLWAWLAPTPCSSCPPGKHFSMQMRLHAAARAIAEGGGGRRAGAGGSTQGR